LLIEVHCGRCGLVFLVCRRCWRGQIYCSEECRIEGMRRNHREAERRYRQTDKGKRAHREGENRRRHRLIMEGKKKMDDASSIPSFLWCMGLIVFARLVVMHCRAWFDKTGRCHFCGSLGKVVEVFPRRGYGPVQRE
jgi:hypothetical protein